MKQEKEETKQDERTELEQENKDLKNTVQRVQAEFENYKKRVQREQEVFREHATEGLIKELLPILDNFSIALTNNDEETEFSKSIDLTYAQLMEVLQGQGIEKIRAHGEPFNPREHEALITRETQDEPNTVIEVLQEGYKINNKIIRTAKVAVSKQKSEE